MKRKTRVPKKLPGPDLQRRLIEDKLPIWQKLLRLQDWDIKIKWKFPDELGTRAFGYIDWNLSKKVATVELVDPQHLSKDLNYNPEKTLVHELLHVHFTPACEAKDDNSFQSKVHECSIDQVARALILLAREKER